MKKLWKIYNTSEFDEWFFVQTEKHKVQIRDRMSKIERDGHFGDNKLVDSDEDVWELRWKNGRRIYYAFISELNILLLLGGNKNGQSKDISKAKKICRSYQKMG